MINVDEYLILDRRALDALPVEDRFTVLAELAERAGPWIRDQRTVLVDELRAALGSEQEVAQLLDVSRQRLADMGDGPVVLGGVRPALLRRGAELILQSLSGPSPTYTQAATTALELLGHRGRPSYERLVAAARRIKQASAGVRVDELADAERATLRRAVAHAAELAGHATEMSWRSRYQRHEA